MRLNRCQKTTAAAMLMGSLAMGPLVGCESMPGNEEQQGAVIGGLGGAAAGAAVSEDNRLLGALIGGALGAGGGYLVGANWDKIRGEDKDEAREEAIEASRKAERNPASPRDVADARTADLNDDGFVTLDEVVAMEEADLSDREMINRLERTQQYFELTRTQEDYLRDRGVSENVIVAMRDMNPDDSARLASDRDLERRRDNDRYDAVSRERASDRDR